MPMSPVIFCGSTSAGADGAWALELALGLGDAISGGGTVRIEGVGVPTAGLGA